MDRLFKTFPLILLIFVIFTSVGNAIEHHLNSRFFYSGNGIIALNSTHTDQTFSGKYREENGEYIEAQLRKIDKVFGCKNDNERISLRLIEFLDYLQDNLSGGKITIISGFRSPNYNANLRKQGKLAAKASLHQYGMAADISIQGVLSEKIWEYIKELGFGGAGYYHGKNLHIDVGPARWWDEKTSGVGSGLADENKLVMLVSDKDIYKPEEVLKLDFVRMTEWPIGVKWSFFLKQIDGSKKPKEIKPIIVHGDNTDSCHIFYSKTDMSDISWQIPKKIESGEYNIIVEFCDKKWAAMPDSIESNKFEIFPANNQ